MMFLRKRGHRAGRKLRRYCIISPKDGLHMTRYAFDRFYESSPYVLFTLVIDECTYSYFDKRSTISNEKNYRFSATLV